jgi:hypothetical protein
MHMRSLCLAVALWLVAAAASALPTGPIVSGNGQLEFSNFQFFSPGHTVDESEISVSVLADGILLSGPVSATNELKGFFVTYDVTALGPGIVGASLSLDSQIEQDAFGLVLATKRILGGPKDHYGWDEQDPWKGHDPWKKSKGHHGPSGWKGKADDWTDRHQPFGFADHRTLAFLKTAQWHHGKGSFAHPDLGLGNDGAIRLVEAGFAARQSIQVVDHVLVSGVHGSATWESSTNRFMVVPEPGTAGLTLLGLGLLVHRSRRRR